MPFKTTKLVHAMTIHSSIDMMVLSPWCNKPKVRHRKRQRLHLLRARSQQDVT